MKITRAEALSQAGRTADARAPVPVDEPLEPATSFFLVAPIFPVTIDLIRGAMDWIYSPYFWAANLAMSLAIFIPLEIKRRRNLRLREAEARRLLEE